MGPTWVLPAPDGPHVGPMNFAIRVHSSNWTRNWIWLCLQMVLASNGARPSASTVLTTKLPMLPTGFRWISVISNHLCWSRGIMQKWPQNLANIAVLRQFSNTWHGMIAAWILLINTIYDVWYLFTVACSYLRWHILIVYCHDRALGVP